MMKRILFAVAIGITWLLPTSVSAEHAGPTEYEYFDQGRAVRLTPSTPFREVELELCFLYHSTGSISKSEILPFSKKNEYRGSGDNADRGIIAVTIRYGNPPDEFYMNPNRDADCAASRLRTKDRDDAELKSLSPKEKERVKGEERRKKDEAQRATLAKKYGNRLQYSFAADGHSISLNSEPGFGVVELTFCQKKDELGRILPDRQVFSRPSEHSATFTGGMYNAVDFSGRKISNVSLVFPEEFNRVKYNSRLRLSQIDELTGSVITIRQFFVPPEPGELDEQGKEIEHPCPGSTTIESIKAEVTSRAKRLGSQTVKFMSAIFIGALTLAGLKFLFD